MKHFDFIMYGLQPWDIEIGSNFKNIALEISKYHRVLYVNRPLDFITKWKHPQDTRTRARLRKISKGTDPLENINPNLVVFTPPIILSSINFLPSGNIYNYLNRRNSKRLGAEINYSLNKLNMRADVLLIDNDFYHGLYLKEFLKPKMFVYYLRDYLRSQTYFKKHGAISEPRIIQTADAVASNSLFLKNYAEEYNKKSFYVGQGCEVESFMDQNYEVPGDIEPIASPRIGYCGALLSSRLDIELLLYIAKFLPTHNLILIGPEDEDFRTSDLHKLKNVFMLGNKPPSALPAYVQHFDICINPQKLNEMTIGNYPRKIDEYLAAGKPVVATKTETMMYFKDVVYLADSNQDFVGKIKIGLNDKNNEQKIRSRVQMAKNHTWKASVEKIYEIIKRIENESL